MELVRKNIEKHRETYFCGDHYKKIWMACDPDWIIDHVMILDTIVPGYVLDYGTNWINFNVVPGTPASEFEHTEEFIQKIKNFCFAQIESTAPWYHGDWTLSNIIINDQNIQMVDWDNVGKYSLEEVHNKLNADLKSAFGEGLPCFSI